MSQELSHEEIERLIEAAMQMVFALCKVGREGGRNWTLFIPVRPDDPDVVLCEGLTSGRDGYRVALKEWHRLQAENERLRKALEVYADHASWTATAPGGYLKRFMRDGPHGFAMAEAALKEATA